MSLKSSKRFLSLLFIPILLTMIGCGGKNGGTAVEIPTTDDGVLIADGGFEFGSDAWSGNASNLQPEPGNEANTVNYADVAVAGQPFDVSLSQALSIIQGNRYTLTFRAKTNTVADGSLAARTAGTRTIFAGVGLNEEPWTNVVQEITLTTEWQKFILTLDAITFGIENSRVFFDMGADTGLVLLDDVVLEDMGVIPTTSTPVSTDGELLSNGGFEEGTTHWIGNAANVTDELLGVDGTKANFANLDAAAANAFDVNLSQVVPIIQGETYTLTFQAISNVSRSLIAGIGLNEDPWTNNSQTVDLTTEWQTFTLTLSAADFGSDNSRVLFDMGAEAGQVIIDNVSLKKVGGTTPTTPTTPTEPTEPTVSGSVLTLTMTANGASEVRMTGAFWEWDPAGGPVAENNGDGTWTVTLDPIPTENMEYLWVVDGVQENLLDNSPQNLSCTPVTDGANYANRIWTVNSNHVQGDVYDLCTGNMTIPTTPSNCPVPAAFDDGLLVNGDFQGGGASWTGTDGMPNVEEISCNKINYANLEAAAANPWDVNIQQVVSITQGKTYTLSFRAKSDRVRPLTAGLGLNYDPWTSVESTVNLSADWAGYSLTLVANNFGDVNNRVFFNMGASAGEVSIDNVRLIEDSGTPPQPVTEPATAAPAPTAAAANVMSIFSNVYGNAVGINTDPDWGQATDSTVVQVAGDDTLKYAGLNYQGTLFDALDVTGMDTFHFDYWTADSTALNAFVIKEGGGETAYPVTLTTGSWQTVSIPLTAFAPVDMNGVNQLKFDGNGTVFLDNIYFSTSGTTTPATEPTTAAPAPTAAAADVMSIFSNVYGNAAGLDTNPNWGQATATTVEQIAGDDTLKYAGLNYQGTLYDALDVTGMDTFHFDYWTADSTALNAFVIKSGGGETAYPVTLTTGSWQSVSVPLTAFTGVDMSGVDQLKFDGNGTVFLDNIYFSTSGTTTPATEPTTAAPAPTAAAADVMSIFSNVYGNAAGLDTNPNWGQSTASTVEQVAGDDMLKYAGLNYQGTLYDALDVTGMDTFHFDYWTADSTALNAYVIKSGGGETAYPVTLTTGSWQTVSVPLTAFTGVDMNGVDQLKFDGNGTVFLDNIYFSTSGTTTPPTGGELTTNGDFETGNFTGWTNYNVLPVITTDSAGGASAANLVVGEAQLSVLKQERIAAGIVMNGQTLNISFKMKGTAGAGGVVNPKLVLEDDSSGATGIVLETIAVPTAGFTTYSYSQAVSAPVADGISLEFAVACGAVSGCNANVVIDDVSITIQ